MQLATSRSATTRGRLGDAVDERLYSATATWLLMKDDRREPLHQIRLSEQGQCLREAERGAGVRGKLRGARIEEAIQRGGVGDDVFQEPVGHRAGLPDRERVFRSGTVPGLLPGLWFTRFDVVLDPTGPNR
jgi:hypothetical protein